MALDIHEKAKEDDSSKASKAKIHFYMANAFYDSKKYEEAAPHY